MYTHLPDEEVVRLILERGDKDDRPFMEFFRRFQISVWRVCFGIMQHEQDAEDMTQETFFKAFRSLGQFEGRASLKTWLTQIAINTCRNEIRRRASRPESPMSLQEDELQVSPALITHPIQVREIQQDIHALLTQLPADDRETLILREVLGYGYAEMAEILNIGLSAAKMRVQRARLALRNVYQRMNPET